MDNQQQEDKYREEDESWANIRDGRTEKDDICEDARDEETEDDDIGRYTFQDGPYEDNAGELLRRKKELIIGGAVVGVILLLWMVQMAAKFALPDKNTSILAQPTEFEQQIDTAVSAMTNAQAQINAQNMQAAIDELAQYQEANGGDPEVTARLRAMQDAYQAQMQASQAALQSSGNVMAGGYPDYGQMAQAYANAAVQANRHNMEVQRRIRMYEEEASMYDEYDRHDRYDGYDQYDQSEPAPYYMQLERDEW